MFKKITKNKNIVNTILVFMRGTLTDFRRNVYFLYYVSHNILLFVSDNVYFETIDFNNDVLRKF